MKQKMVSQATLQMDFIPTVTPREARECALVMSGVSIRLKASPVDLETVLNALGIPDFLKDSQ